MLLPSYDVGGDWFDFVENRDGVWLAIAAARTAMAIQRAVTDCWKDPLQDDGTIVVMAVG